MAGCNEGLESDVRDGQDGSNKPNLTRYFRYLVVAEGGRGT